MTNIQLVRFLDELDGNDVDEIKSTQNAPGDFHVILKLATTINKQEESHGEY